MGRCWHLKTQDRVDTIWLCLSCQTEPPLLSHVSVVAAKQVPHTGLGAGLGQLQSRQDNGGQESAPWGEELSEPVGENERINEKIV